MFRLGRAYTFLASTRFKVSSEHSNFVCTYGSCCTYLSYLHVSSYLCTDRGLCRYPRFPAILSRTGPRSGLLRANCPICRVGFRIGRVLRLGPYCLPPFYCLLLPFTTLLLPFYCPSTALYCPLLPSTAFCCLLLPCITLDYTFTVLHCPSTALLPFTALYYPFTALYCPLLPFHRPFTALYCLSLPFTALYYLLLPFAAFSCLLLPCITFYYTFEANSLQHSGDITHGCSLRDISVKTGCSSSAALFTS